MNRLITIGAGCGCLPAVLLMLASVACFVLVGVGAINYSEEDTAMIVGGVLAVCAFLVAIPGVVLLVAGFVQSRQGRNSDPV